MLEYLYMLCNTRREEKEVGWSTCICCVTLGEGEKGVDAGVPVYAV